MIFLKKFKVLFLILLGSCGFSPLQKSLSSLSSQNPPTEKLTVLTFNAGLLKAINLVDLVPFVDKRITLQKYAWLNLLSQKHFKNKNIIIGLQEVWTQKAFETYQSIAQQLNLNMAPLTYNEVKTSGIITLTSLPIEDYKFLPFSVDSPTVKRGILHTTLNVKGRSLPVMNLHTNYSDSKGFTEKHRIHFIEIINHLKSLDSSPALIVGDFNGGDNLVIASPTKNNQVFEFGKIAWRKFIHEMESIGFKPIDFPEAITWNNANPLVNIPALPIRIIMGTGKDGKTWEESTSQLDQIFYRGLVQIVKGRTFFNKPLRVGDCDKTLRSCFISDHSGLATKVEF
jgi:hypothetical protein